MLKSTYSKGIVEAGCDEAGRGCLAGPVVAAAVILPPGFEDPLLNDSKQLDKEARDQLRLRIEAEALAWHVAQCSPQEIDEVNILNASFKAMHRAVDALVERKAPSPELLLIDGNRFTPYLGIPHVCIIKGDGKFAAIAAASILAKTHRDELMHNMARQYPGYSWETNVGYPTPAHKKAIASLGPTPLHRRSFKWQ